MPGVISTFRDGDYSNVVDKRIGDAYLVVKNVQENLPAIITVSEGFAAVAANSAAAIAAKNAADADVVLTNADVVTTTAQAVIAVDNAALTAADRVQTGLDAVATAADRVQTGLDRVQTGLDVIATNADVVATALDVIATTSARDAALIQAGVYTTEALGRAAVADGQAFKVQGSGDVAAYEYRRTNSTTSVLIATYPSKLAVDTITPAKTTFLHIGKNKFNKAAVTTGYYITSSGVIAANATYDISDYIPVVAGTAYVCNGSGIRFSCYFDENKVVIAGGTAALITTFTPPTGAAYIRASMYNADIDTFQVEIGATATAYASYQYTLSDAAGVGISASVADLAITTEKLADSSITPAKTTFLPVGKNKFNKAAVTTGYYITYSGVIAANATYDISDYIPVVAGTAYICNGSGIRFSCYFDANYAVVAGGTAAGILTFTPPTGAAYVRVSMWHSDLDLFQLEIGTTATAYASYQYVLSDAAGTPISASVADSGVTSIKLADLAVTTAKLASSAVTPAKTTFLQIGKNKFNKAAVTTGYYMTNTGSILANASYDISEYIPVVAGTTYANSGLLGYALRYSCYFDANFAVVAGGSSVYVATFTPPTGAAYVRVTTYHADIDTFQLEIGATATAYEAYQYTLSDSSGIPISASSTSSTTAAPVLVMPPTIYGVQGRECSLYIDNLHLGDSTLFNHDVTNTAVNGAQQRERWTWTPTGVQSTGTLTVSAYDKTQGTVLASATTNQRAAASTAGSGTTKTINVIGDSLINAAVITQTVIDIAATDVMGVSFIGTRGTAPNKHEGRGGWKISDYATVGRTFYAFTVSGVVTSPAINSTVYTNNSSTFTVQEVDITAGSGTIICERSAGTNAPSASGTLTKSSGTGDATIAFSASSTVSGNPFWIGGALDYPQYLTNNSLATPDWVLIHLGINDVFNYVSDATVIAAATAAFANLDLLITSIKAAGAGVKVGLMIPTPPASQDGFAASYGTGQPAWRDKRNIMLWAQELITKYTGQEASRIYLVPSNTALDVENGYPLAASAPVNSRSSVMVQRQNNGVHPDTSGYQQIGDCLWAFLKCNA